MRRSIESLEAENPSAMRNTWFLMDRKQGARRGEPLVRSIESPPWTEQTIVYHLPFREQNFRPLASAASKPWVLLSLLASSAWEEGKHHSEYRIKKVRDYNTIRCGLSASYGEIAPKRQNCLSFIRSCQKKHLTLSQGNGFNKQKKWKTSAS